MLSLTLPALIIEQHSSISEPEALATVIALLPLLRRRHHELRPKHLRERLQVLLHAPQLQRAVALGRYFQGHAALVEPAEAGLFHGPGVRALQAFRQAQEHEE